MPPSFPTRTHLLVFPSQSTLLPSATAPLSAAQDVVSAPASTTTSPPCCRSMESVVLLDLHTRIVIPNYHLYYHSPISAFRPQYHALDDGSLVAEPLISDLRSANIELSVMSSLAMFFLVTTVLSIQYLRRGKIKKKLLFYILCASQALGLISMITTVVPFFDQFVSCTSIGSVVIAGSVTSYSLLMTGILGIKAYRCLNNSVLVPLVLGILRTAVIVLVILDLATFKSGRRLSGSCMPSINFEIIPVIIILQAVESAFICVCFVFAVWQASRSSSEQGRISISLSLDDKETSLEIDNDGNENSQTRRGWWDYVPEGPRQEQPHFRRSVDHSRSNSDPSGIIHYVGSKLHDLWSYSPGDGQPLHRATSLPAEQSAHQPPRTSIAFTNVVVYDTEKLTRNQGIPLRSQEPPLPLPSPSTMSRLSKYMPRMQLLRRVLKNELYYTALVTIIYVAIAVMMLVGMSSRFALDSVGWAAISWFTISLCTMHSFGRVVRRHEREAILQHPSAWDPVYRAELEASRAFRKGRRFTRRTFSPVSVASRRPRRNIPLDPFEDPRLQGPSSESVKSRRVPQSYSSENAGRSLGTRPWASTSRVSSVSFATDYEDGLDAQPEHLYTQWGGAEVLPSPAPSDCPAPNSTSASVYTLESDAQTRNHTTQAGKILSNVATDPGSRRPSFHTRTIS